MQKPGQGQIRSSNHLIRLVKPRKADFAKALCEAEVRRRIDHTSDSF
jgi:hypothetical protein